MATLIAGALLMLVCGTPEAAETTPARAIGRLESPAPLRAPVSPTVVVEGVDLPRSPWLPGHRGVDLATSPGATVLSPAAGTVTYVGRIAGRGVITVAIGATGMRTTLEPVDATVSIGQSVAQGQPLGEVQAQVAEPAVGHCAPAACLHWGLRRGETYLDPLDWTQGWGPIRLKPIA